MKLSEREVLKRYGNIWVYLVYDYSQVEIRVLAEMSDCKRLIKVIASGADIHAAVGHDMTGRPPEVFQDKMDEKPRVMMKSLHFSIVYGKGVDGLHEALLAAGIEIEREEVQEFYDDYFEKYHEVRTFIDDRQAFAENNGYVVTLFGFQREIAKHDEGRGSFWGNQAINSPIQGTAHQIILIAIAECKRKPKTFWALQNMKMEVHDALYYRVRLRDIEEAYKQGKYLLETQVKKGIFRRFGFELKVPLLAEAKVGFRQGALVGYEGQSVDKLIEKWLTFNAKMDSQINESLEEIAR